MEMSVDELGTSMISNGTDVMVNTKNGTRHSAHVLESEKEFVEVYSIGVKIAFVILACLSLWSSVTAIILLHRSKKVPYAAKFLSAGLLTFDALFIVTSTLRKFITDHVLSLNMMAFVTIILQLAVFTVALMALERYILFLKPMWYHRIATKRFIRKIVLSIWICEVCVGLLVRYFICYMKYRTMSVFTEAGLCKSIMTFYYGGLLLIILVTSFTCYVKIFNCIRSKGRLSVVATAKRIHSYRSTSLVLLYLIVIVATSVAYGIIIILVMAENLRYTNFRLAMDAVSSFNCILDPFLYVLWFKECRLQLLAIIAVFLTRYRHKAEQMRIEVYDIVTKESKG